MRQIFIGSAVVGLLTLSSATAQAGDLAIGSVSKPVASSTSLASALQLCTPLGVGLLQLPPVLTCFQMGSSTKTVGPTIFLGSTSMGRMPRALVAMPRADDPMTGWNVTALMSHQWTDRLRSEVGVRHLQLDAINGDALRVTDSQVTAASAGLTYSFFRGFDIGLEFQYANLKSKFGSINVTAPHSGATGDERNVLTRLRVDRAF